ncbi:MAG: hypothetical protein ACI8W7_004425, partial [Gammaproteobacteria bacterium]
MALMVMDSNQSGKLVFDYNSREQMNVLRNHHRSNRSLIRPRSVLSFDSPLTLTVVKFPAVGDVAVLGTTPGDNPIVFSIDPGDTWTVFAPGLTSADMAQLVADLNDHAVPSLTLPRNTLG